MASLLRLVSLFISLAFTLAVQDLQIVTPLQALTIPDGGFEMSGDLSRRQAFLEQFKANVEAEHGDGKQLEFLDGAQDGKSKTNKAIAADSRLQQSNEQKYQFVGVIEEADDKASSEAAISWYARPKPKNARWSMRLIHVNREAVLKDLFDQGKLDVYGKYETIHDETTGERVVHAKYAAKPRSWR